MLDPALEAQFPSGVSKLLEASRTFWKILDPSGTFWVKAPGNLENSREPSRSFYWISIRRSRKLPILPLMSI
jgi:hypothetical protein